MKFYMVKPEYDQCRRYTERPNHSLKVDGRLVRNELYTEKERAKLMNGDWMFEEVEVKKNRTYWFFGCRFNMDKNPNEDTCPCYI